MEDYGFEYSDEDYGEEDVDIENQYYNSKGTVWDGLGTGLDGILNIFALILFENFKHSGLVQV